MLFLSKAKFSNQQKNPCCVSCFGNRNTALNVNINKALHTGKAITSNRKGVSLVSNKKAYFK